MKPKLATNSNSKKARLDASGNALAREATHLHFDAGALRIFGKRYAEAFIAMKSGESNP